MSQLRFIRRGAESLHHPELDLQIRQAHDDGRVRRAGFIHDRLQELLWRLSRLVALDIGSGFPVPHGSVVRAQIALPDFLEPGALQAAMRLGIGRWESLGVALVHLKPPMAISAPAATGLIGALAWSCAVCCQRVYETKSGETISMRQCSVYKFKTGLGLVCHSFAWELP